MSPARLAWGLFVLAVLLAPAGLILNTIGEQNDFLIFLLFQLFFAAVQLTTAGIGAVVASRLPNNRVGWILLAMGAGMGIRQTLIGYGQLGITTASGPLPGDDVAAWLGQWIFIPIVAGGVVFLLHLFPDGRFMSRRWRVAGIASGTSILLLSAADALRPGRLKSVETVENPFGASGALADLVGVVHAIEGPLGLLVFGLAATGIGVRLRRSTGVERQQIKWITYTLALVAAGLAATAFPDAAVYALLFAMLALAAAPVAAGVAILRYRLYDIDVVINRTLVYGALTATLAGTYLGSVLLLQLVLSGVTSDSSLAVAGSTLVVAALFQPARGRIQAGVDRRFFRRRYDARRTLEAFAGRLREEVDIDALGGELRAVVVDTMAPRHVSLWLRER